MILLCYTVYISKSIQMQCKFNVFDMVLWQYLHIALHITMYRYMVQYHGITI